ncbi:MAG: HAD family hydrolase [Ktedonobacterales bacterium]
MVAQQSTTQPAFRLVATDLDGTLLDPAGQLSARTLRAARALQRARVPLILATSRRLTGALPVAEALGCPLTLLLYDGALVRSWPDGAELHRDALDAEIGQQAVEVLAAHRLRPIVQHCDARGEYLLIGPRVPRTRRADPYLALYHSQATEAPVAELCRNRGDPLRIVVFGERRRLRAAARDIATLPCGWQFLPIGNYGTSELTVFSPTASKAIALEHLALRFGIGMENVLAVGDGINDVSMVRAAGLGIAMANGGRATSAVADVIAPPNGEDGAAWAIERFILGIVGDTILHDDLVAV